MVLCNYANYNCGAENNMNYYGVQGSKIINVIYDHHNKAAYYHYAFHNCFCMNGVQLHTTCNHYDDARV